MRRSHLIALALTAIITTSCGSSKQSAPYPDYMAGRSQTKGVKLKREECEQLAMDAPVSELRAYASAVSGNRDFSRQKAVLYAKGQLSSDIEAVVLNVMKAYRGETAKGTRQTYVEDVKQDIAQMAEQTLENCRVVCSNLYAMPDGTYECHVCVSVPSGEVEKIAGATVLTQDEKLGVQFEAEQFRSSYAQELAKFRQQRQQGLK